MVQKKSSAKTPKNQSSKVVIHELKTKQDWQSMYPLIKQHNKTMTRKTYDALLPEMLARGYRCIGAYQGEKLVGVMGFWVGVRFWCKKYIDIDNVVVDKSLRSKGIGSKMMAWVEAEGRRQKCDMSMLDCYVSYHASHRFYFREGYCILGYHFTKNL
jgi:GNAT superfamily N-acetyltransferase